MSDSTKPWGRLPKMYFEVGKTYTTTSPCDQQMLVAITIKDRTKCYVTSTEDKRFKIQIHLTCLNEEVEMIRPWGRCSL